MTASLRPTREARARFDDQALTVYQAYSPAIAEAAASGRPVRPAVQARGHMTWIKPSFRWMMYRSGWATKLGQERVLAIAIRRDDNSMAESFFASIETELFWPEPHRRVDSHRDAKLAVFDYIEVFHNRQRRRTSIGIPPVTFETRHAERLAWQHDPQKLGVHRTG